MDGRVSLEMFVGYETFFLLGDGEPGEDWDEAFEGQGNALCGGATGNYLCLRTEPGVNEITVAVHRAAPPAQAGRSVTDVVEVSLPAQSAGLTVTTWDGEGQAEPISVPTAELRVRYSIDPGDGDRTPKCYLDIWPAAMAPEAIILESSIGRGHRLTVDDIQPPTAPSGAAAPRVLEPVVPATLPLAFDATSDPPISWSAQWQPDGQLEQLQARWELTDDDSDRVVLTLLPAAAGTGAVVPPLIADPPDPSAMAYQRVSGSSIFSWTDRLGSIEIASPRKRLASQWVHSVQPRPTQLPPFIA